MLPNNGVTRMSLTKQQDEADGIYKEIEQRQKELAELQAVHAQRLEWISEAQRISKANISKAYISDAVCATVNDFIYNRGQEKMLTTSALFEALTNGVITPEELGKEFQKWVEYSLADVKKSYAPPLRRVDPALLRAAQPTQQDSGPTHRLEL